MQNKKDIAIIIPYINLPNYVLDLIRTIYTKYSYHIYLIDNNSDKKTKEELADLDNREYITIIYNNTNIGCASAWNQGIKIAIEECNMNFLNRAKSFLKSEDGPTATEYAVMLALIIVACIATITSLGGAVSNVFSGVEGELPTV